MLAMLGEKIHDNRLLRLVGQMLAAGYSRQEVDLETNKTLVRSFIEAWNTRNFDASMP